MNIITKSKIKRIHILKHRLKLSDDSYRTILSSFGVSSSKELDEVGAVQLLILLEKMVHSQVANSGRQYPQFKMKYDELADRPGMASPKQLRMVEAIWADVSYQKDPLARAKALETFLLRICGVSKIEWLEPKHISMLVRALSSMKQQIKRRVLNEQPA